MSIGACLKEPYININSYDSNSSTEKAVKILEPSGIKTNTNISHKLTNSILEIGTPINFAIKKRKQFRINSAYYEIPYSKYIQGDSLVKKVGVSMNKRTISALLTTDLAVSKASLQDNIKTKTTLTGLALLVNMFFNLNFVMLLCGLFIMFIFCYFFNYFLAVKFNRDTDHLFRSSILNFAIIMFGLGTCFIAGWAFSLSPQLVELVKYLSNLPGINTLGGQNIVICLALLHYIIESVKAVGSVLLNYPLSGTIKRLPSNDLNQ